MLKTSKTNILAEGYTELTLSILLGTASKTLPKEEKTLNEVKPSKNIFVRIFKGQAACKRKSLIYTNYKILHISNLVFLEQRKITRGREFARIIRLISRLVVTKTSNDRKLPQTTTNEHKRSQTTSKQPQSTK